MKIVISSGWITRAGATGGSVGEVKPRFTREIFSVTSTPALMVELKLQVVSSFTNKPTGESLRVDPSGREASRSEIVKVAVVRLAAFGFVKTSLTSASFHKGGGIIGGTSRRDCTSE